MQQNYGFNACEKEQRRYLEQVQANPGMRKKWATARRKDEGTERRGDKGTEKPDAGEELIQKRIINYLTTAW